MKIALATLLALTASGCLIDTVPLPEGEPGRDTVDAGEQDPSWPPTTGSGDDRDQCSVGVCGAPSDGGAASQPDLYYAETPGGFVIAGASGAAPGAGDVVATNDSRGTAALWPTRVDGTFCGVITAGLWDAIELDYRQSGEVVATESVVLSPPSAANYAAGGDFYEAVQNGEQASPDLAADITAVSYASGIATVSGTVASFNAGLVVVAVNVARAATSRDVPDASGSFTIPIVAASGEQLILFTVEPAVNGGGSTPIAVTVP